MMWSSPSNQEIDIEKENGFQTVDKRQQAFIPKVRLQKPSTIRTESFKTMQTLLKFNKKYSQKIDLNGSETDEAEKEFNLMDSDQEKSSPLQSNDNAAKVNRINSPADNRKELTPEREEFPKEMMVQWDSIPPKRPINDQINMKSSLDPKRKQKSPSNSSSIAEEIEESIVEEIASEESSSMVTQKKENENLNLKQNSSYQVTEITEKEETIKQASLQEYSEDFEHTDTIKEISSLDKSIKTESNMKTIHNTKLDSLKVYENILTIDDLLENVQDISSPLKTIQQEYNKLINSIEIEENQNSIIKTDSSMSLNKNQINLISKKSTKSYNNNNNSDKLKIEEKINLTQTENSIKQLEQMNKDEININKYFNNQSISSKSMKSHEKLNEKKNKSDYSNDFDLETTIDEDLEASIIDEISEKLIKSIHENLQEENTNIKTNGNDYPSNSHIETKQNISKCDQIISVISNEQSISSSWSESISIQSEKRPFNKMKGKIKKRNVGIQCELNNNVSYIKQPVQSMKLKEKPKQCRLLSSKHPKTLSSLAKPKRPPFIQSTYWLQEIENNSYLPGEHLQKLILSRLDDNPIPNELIADWSLRCSLESVKNTMRVIYKDYLNAFNSPLE